MALMFIDSFDHYDTLSLKWSDGKTAIINLGGVASRTGIGCCVCFPFGPQLNFVAISSCVMGTAYKTQTLSGDIIGVISGTGVFATKQVRLRMNADGSVSVLAGNDPFPNVLGTSSPNLISVNNYAYCEMKISAFSGAGTVTVRSEL